MIDAGGVDWIRMVYDSKNCLVVVKAIMNIKVPWSGGGGIILLAKEVLGLQEKLRYMELGSQLFKE